MHFKSRQSNSGHCFSFGPLDLIYLAVACLLSLVAPIATVIKIILTVTKRGTGFLEGPNLPVDECLPIIKGPLVSAAELDILSVASDEEHAHCPVCATALSSEEIVTCSKCQTRHHQDCWEFNNNCCAVYGCAMTTEVLPTAVDRSKPTPMTAMAQYQFDEVRQRFRHWFWSYRLQWWFTVSFCSFAASGFFIATLGEMTRGLISTLSTGAFYAFIVALTFFFFARVFRYTLEESFERLPVVPPERMANLLDKIEKSKSRPVLERVFEWAPYIFTMMAGLPIIRILLLGRSSLIISTLYMVICLLFGGFFIWMALISTRRHRATLERIRYRLRGASKV